MHRHESMDGNSSGAATDVTICWFFVFLCRSINLVEEAALQPARCQLYFSPQKIVLSIFLILEAQGWGSYFWFGFESQRTSVSRRLSQSPNWVWQIVWTASNVEWCLAGEWRISFDDFRWNIFVERIKTNIASCIFLLMASQKKNINKSFILYTLLSTLNEDFEEL